MEKYRTYPVYKESSKAALGAIPDSWGITKIKYITQCLDGRRVPLNGSERSEMPGKVPYWGANGIVDYVDRPLFNEELVLIGEDGAPFFDKNKPVAFHIYEPVWINNHIHVLKPNKKIDYRFLVHCLNSIDYSLYIKGSTRDKLNQSDLSDISVWFPPKNEQEMIVAFLDYETTKIDRLIARQERLIELLKEKRQAVISHAVTKGLNPDAPMKDSGVAWLGEVPAHWGVTRVARLFEERVEYGRSDLPVLSVSIHYGVTDKELTQEESNRKLQRIENKESYKIVEAGDLVYNIMRAWQGAFGATKVDGLVSPAYVIAKPLNDLETEYFEAVLRTGAGIEEMRRYSKGITDFRLRLYWDEFRSIQLPIPPLSEQKAVVERLNEVTQTTERIISKAEESIALMKEHRVALISAAVTGQIDLRGRQKSDTEPEETATAVSI